LIFDPIDNTAFDCYVKAVHDLVWLSDSFSCDMSSVTTHLEVSGFEAVLNSLDEMASSDKHVVIDNTPLPKGGA